MTNSRKYIRTYSVVSLSNHSLSRWMFTEAMFPADTLFSRFALLLRSRFCYTQNRAFYTFYPVFYTLLYPFIPYNKTHKTIPQHDSVTYKNANTAKQAYPLIYTFQPGNKSTPVSSKCAKNEQQ